MSSVPSPDLSSLPIPAVRRVDEVCDAFEEALQAGQQPHLEDYLGTVEESVRPALLRQLLLLEWDYCQQRGDRLDLEGYLARFPEHATLLHETRDEHEVETASDSGPLPEARATGTNGLPTEPTAPGSSATTQLPQDWKDRGYLILSQLGRGGMGTVYLARQTAADRLVALKVLQDGPEADPEALDRFRREARTLARLQHPNIVPIFEVGEHQGRPFYSMEYCPGGSLAAYLHGTLLPPQEAATLLETLARAAHAAHQSGIIHRDLKPANILLQRQEWPRKTQKDTRNREGEIPEEEPENDSSPPFVPFCVFRGHFLPKLADFGLAKTRDAIAQTQTGAVLGTPQYMAPEQARGDSRSVGAAADVYALGAILYECLTGRPPFRGATPLDTVLQVIAADPLPPARLQPNVPCDLETICLKCLHKEPHRRYPDAAALAEDLRRFRVGEAIRARPVGVWERTWKWVKRRPAAAALLGVLLLSGLALALSVWAFGERDDAIEARKKAEERRRKAEYQTALTQYDQDLVRCQQEGAPRGLLWLARSLKVAVQAEAADLEELIRKQLAAWSRDVRPLKGVLTHGNYVMAVAFSPDGKTLLTGSLDKTARLWEAATGKPRGTPLQDQDKVYAVAFSPDGELMLTGGSATGQLWATSTGKPLGPPLQHQNRVLAVAFSPDGKTVLTGSHDKTAQLWEAATGKPLGSPLLHQGMVRAVAFSPDGKTILTGSDEHTARFWEAATGKPLGPLLKHQDNVFAVAFSPDGKTVLTGSSDATAQLWETATGKPLGNPLRHQVRVMAVAFSPDGKTVLTGSSDCTARLWEAATGEPLGPPLQHQRQVRAAVFSPDGKTVMTGCDDNTVKLWELARGKPLALLLRHQAIVPAVAYSPDGKMVLTGSNDGTARLWEAATGKPLGPPLRHQSAVWAVAFSPDGKTVLTGCYHGTARLWDAATGQPLCPPLPHAAHAWPLAFSPDGKSFVTASDKTTRLWEAATGKPLGPPLQHEHYIRGVAFLPNGTVVLAGPQGINALLWEAATGNLLGAPLPHQAMVMSVALSPDGKTVLTGSSDNTARLWETATGKPLGPPLPHQDWVWGVAFSADGQTVLTGSNDRTARLWEAATGRPLGPPLHHPNHVETVAFSPDGRTVLTGCQDNTARLWEVIPPVEGEPERILLWAQVITGLELDEHDTVRALDAPTWNDRKQKLDYLDGFPIQYRP